MKINQEQARYFPQLDFLRAVAITLVIISHWFPATHWLNRYTPNGMFGVVIFFVLSGYLITRTLLDARYSIKYNIISRSSALFSFYMKRILRIFPLYYLSLAVLMLLGEAHISLHWTWHALYLSNIFFYLNPKEYAAIHLWTLSVEEQFYLVWPFVILFSGNKSLPYTIAAFILIGPLFRVIAGSLYPEYFVYRLTPSVFDSFGLGGLLAYLHLHSKISTKKITHTVLILMVLSVLCCAILFIIVHRGNGNSIKPEILLFSNLCYTLICLWMVNLAVQGIKGPLKNVFEFPAFIYLGRISYSLYLFHWFIPFFCNKAGLHLDFNTNVGRCYGIIILISLSSVSWFFFEKPILRLKKYFTLAPAANTISEPDR